MYCGSLRVGVSYSQQAPHVAARMLAWAGSDAGLIWTSTSTSLISIVAPGQLFENRGPLQLIEGGYNLSQLILGAPGIAKYQARSWRVGNGEAASVTDPTKVPTLTNMTISEDGMTVTTDWIGPGAAYVDWGDGTVNTLHSHTFFLEGMHRIQCYTLRQLLPRSETCVMIQRGC